MPLAVAVALFITFYAPRRLAQALGYLIDLLAAIPSIVYGLWGVAVLGPASVRVQQWLGRPPRLDPDLRRAGVGDRAARCSSSASCWRVMILPIITAITREVFAQTPRAHEGGARARRDPLGDDPHGRAAVRRAPAIIGGSMLGLGRALGETMAVAIILSVSGGITFNLISSGNPSTIAANIALALPGLVGPRRQRADRSGLVLFGITLVVNMVARARHRPAATVLEGDPMSTHVRPSTSLEASAPLAALARSAASCPESGASALAAAVRSRRRRRARAVLAAIDVHRSPAGCRRRGPAAGAHRLRVVRAPWRARAQGHGPAVTLLVTCAFADRRSSRSSRWSTPSSRAASPASTRVLHRVRCATSSARAAAATTRSSARWSSRR